MRNYTTITDGKIHSSYVTVTLTVKSGCEPLAALYRSYRR